MNLTEKAYEYAKSKGKVNQGVIEAYKDGYNKGVYDVKNLSEDDLFDLIKAKFATRQQIEYEIRMSGEYAGLNDKKKKEAHLRAMLDEFLGRFKLEKGDDQ